MTILYLMSAIVYLMVLMTLKNIYKAITTKGNYDLWLKTIKECRIKKEIRLLMAATLASPLIEKIINTILYSKLLEWFIWKW